MLTRDIATHCLAGPAATGRSLTTLHRSGANRPGSARPRLTAPGPGRSWLTCPGLTRPRLACAGLTCSRLALGGTARRHRAGRERAGTAGGLAAWRRLRTARSADSAGSTRSVGGGAGPARNGRRANALSPRHHRRHDRRRGAGGLTRRNRTGPETAWPGSARWALTRTTLIRAGLIRTTLVGGALVGGALVGAALIRATLIGATLIAALIGAALHRTAAATRPTARLTTRHACAETTGPGTVRARTDGLAVPVDPATAPAAGAVARSSAVAGRAVPAGVLASDRAVPARGLLGVVGAREAGSTTEATPAIHRPAETSIVTGHHSGAGDRPGPARHLRRATGHRPGPARHPRRPTGHRPGRTQLPGRATGRRPGPARHRPRPARRPRGRVAQRTRPANRPGSGALRLRPARSGGSEPLTATSRAARRRGPRGGCDRQAGPVAPGHRSRRDVRSRGPWNTGRKTRSRNARIRATRRRAARVSGRTFRATGQRRRTTGQPGRVAGSRDRRRRTGSIHLPAALTGLTGRVPGGRRRRDRHERPRGLVWLRGADGTGPRPLAGAEAGLTATRHRAGRHAGTRGHGRPRTGWRQRMLARRERGGGMAGHVARHDRPSR